MIDICHHPCHVLCSTALQERQKRQFLPLQTAEKPGGDLVLKQLKGVLSDREILSSSASHPVGVGGFGVQLEFFQTKMQQDATRNLYDKFWPELGICSVLLCS